MKLLAWNCRGLGRRRAVQELVDIVQAQNLMIVFLSKTWSDKESMVWVQDKIFFDGLWKAGVNVWVDSFSNYHIDSIVHRGSKDAR